MNNISSFSPDGASLGKSILEYDDNGNAVESNFYDSVGEHVKRLVDKFDHKGNTIERFTFIPDPYIKDTGDTKYIYDDHDNVIEIDDWVLSKYGNGCKKTTNKCDQYGHIIDLKCYEVNSKTVDEKNSYTAKLSLDSHNNVVTKEVYAKRFGKALLVEVDETEITYH